MIFIVLLLCLINVAVCEQCPPGKYGDSCERKCVYPHCYCNLHLDCLACEAGFWDISKNCPFTCISLTCICSNYKNCLACKHGYYGLESNCNKICSPGCDSKTCYNNGTCVTCKTNFAGNKCDFCTDGRYGANCSLQCSRGCEEYICSAIDGSCSCSRYFSGDGCEYCIAGQYGFNCEKICSSGCLTHTCSSADGKCECKDFYKGDTCDDCVEGRNGDHCLILAEQNHPDKTDHFQTGALTGGVIGGVVVLVAAVAITVLVKRRLSQTEAQYYENKRETTTHGGNETQPGPYETLNTGRMENNDRKDTYTSLFTTEQVGMTKDASPNKSTAGLLNAVGGEKDKSGPYEILNATILKENEMSDTYTSLFTTGQAGGTDNDNSQNISMDNLTSPDSCLIYVNTMQRQ